MTDPLRHELLVELRQSAEESRAQLAALRAEIRTASRGAVEASSVEIRAVGASLRGDLRVAEEAAAQRLGAATELVDAGISALRPILERTEVYSSSAARRIAVPANPGTVLVRATPGYVLCAVDDVALLASLMEAGELEPGTRSLIERFLHPGDVFVDVGANLGLHTIAAARRLSGNGRVVAIEPFPDTARLLERTIWLNGFSAICEVKQLALSDSAGEQELYLGPTSGHHSLYPLEGGPGQEARSVEVPVARLDDLLAPDDRVDLMKIDVEGAELAVIGGATGVLSQNPDIALVVEFGPSHLARVGVPSEDWLATFDRLGFTWRAINPDTGVLEERSIADLEADESTNLFFARPASEAWSRVSS